MDNLKKQYEKISVERETIKKQINELKNNEAVKKYFELCNQDKQLISEQEDLEKQIKIRKYSSCNHILVTTLRDYDDLECRFYDYQGCIKCGLDTTILLLGHNYLDCLTIEQKAMYDYVQDCEYFNGIDTELLCDLDLAKAIYSRIKEVHPNIDDETATKYFEIVLDDIRNIKVSEERKISRAKRLSLSSRFNKWN